MTIDTLERVMQERDDLNNRRHRLTDFMSSNSFGMLTKAEQILLRLQHEVMYVYKDILDQRIRIGKP